MGGPWEHAQAVRVLEGLRAARRVFAGSSAERPVASSNPAASPDEVISELQSATVRFPSDTAGKVRHIFKQDTKVYQFMGQDRWIYRHLKQPQSQPQPAA